MAPKMNKAAKTAAAKTAKTPCSGPTDPASQPPAIDTAMPSNDEEPKEVKMPSNDEELKAVKDEPSDGESSIGASRAQKGQGMDPGQVSKMRTMLKKRAKKD